MKDELFEMRIKKFKELFPSLDSEITGLQAYRWHTLLTKSCVEGRKSFFKKNNLDFNKTYTIREFLSLTEKAYNEKVLQYIKKLYD